MRLVCVPLHHKQLECVWRRTATSLRLEHSTIRLSRCFTLLVHYSESRRLLVFPVLRMRAAIGCTLQTLLFNGPVRPFWTAFVFVSCAGEPLIVRMNSPFVMTDSIRSAATTNGSTPDFISAAPELVNSVLQPSLLVL